MIEEKKSGAARSQPATRDEFWSDERVKTFLGMLPPEGVPAGYLSLLKAHRGVARDTVARWRALRAGAGSLPAEGLSRHGAGALGPLHHLLRGSTARYQCPPG